MNSSLDKISKSRRSFAKILTNKPEINHYEMTPFELQEALDNHKKRPLVNLASTSIITRELMLERDDPQEFTNKEFNRDIKKNKFHIFQIKKNIKNLTDD